MTKGTRFTDKFIMNLKPDAKEYWVREGQGFCIRVYPSGEKAWYYIFTTEGRKRFMKLCNKCYPDASLADARIAFNEAKSKVDKGIDPLAEKETAALEREQTPIISKFVDEYISRHAKQHNKSHKEIERALKAEIVPKWGNRKITDIKRRDLVVILDDIADRGAPIMANRVLAYVRKMFSFALDRAVIEINPFLKMKAPAAENERERFLSAIEIKALWGNMNAAKMSDETQRALKLILVTGQRPGEVVGMHGSEIEANEPGGAWWTIPAERSKNGQAHRVYLTKTALELIGGKKGYVFESTMKPRTPKTTEPAAADAKKTPPKPRAMTERALTRAIYRSCPRTEKEIKTTPNLLGVEYFTPHDLRRTASTHMAEAGIPEIMIDQIQNHVARRQRGVTHIYVRYSYDKEKQAAMETWERKLKSITTGKPEGKVVSIQGRKKKAA
jgi:integrase